jgi:hypothetical protein
MKPYSDHPMIRMDPAARQISLLVAPTAITAVLSEMIAALTLKNPGWR